MTTFAYRDGILAADRLAGNGSTVIGMVCKVHRAPDGTIAAAAGPAIDLPLYFDWVDAGRPKDARPETSDDFTGIAITTAGRIFLYEGKCFPLPELIDPPFVSRGSGREFAMGAMAMGATAERAVEISQQFDFGTGGGVDALVLAETVIRLPLRAMGK